MGWLIKCTNEQCEKETMAANIVDLITNHLNNDGWFLCQCGQHGYIEKSFNLQEPGQRWEPYLRGIVLLGKSDEPYQPFVFLVSDDMHGSVNATWFAYYKDLRKMGGRLNLTYGPVTNTDQILLLLHKLTDLGCIKN